jgi:hypothetical protein
VPEQGISRGVAGRIASSVPISVGARAGSAGSTGTGAARWDGESYRSPSGLRVLAHYFSCSVAIVAGAADSASAECREGGIAAAAARISGWLSEHLCRHSALGAMLLGPWHMPRFGRV